MSESSDSVTLNVQIASGDLRILQDGGYSLYITRNVSSGAGREEVGNVIFAQVANESLAATQKLPWTESYQVFQTLHSKVGTPVKSGTEVADIQGGLKATFDESGQYTIAGGPQPGTSFEVVNGWMNGACVCVNNKDPRAGKFTPIYISKVNPIHIKSILLPLKKFNVFWERGLTTDTIIDSTSTPAYRVDLTKGEETIRYENGKWEIVPV